jgi:hypothetical protein
LLEGEVLDLGVVVPLTLKTVVEVVNGSNCLGSNVDLVEDLVVREA